MDPAKASRNYKKCVVCNRRRVPGSNIKLAPIPLDPDRTTSSMPHRCYMNCPTDSYNHLHLFPNPKRYSERFNTWLELLGVQINTTADNNIYDFFKTKHLCNRHFTEKDYNRYHRLNALAIPSKFLKGYKDVISSEAAPTNKDAASGEGPTSAQKTDNAYKASSTPQDTSSGPKPDDVNLVSSENVSAKKIDYVDTKAAPSQAPPSGPSRWPYSYNTRVSDVATPQLQQSSTEKEPKKKIQLDYVSDCSYNPTTTQIYNPNITTDPTSTSVLEDEINIRMQYAYSLDYDEDLFDTRTDTKSSEDTRKITKKLVKLKPISSFYSSEYTKEADYEIEELDEQILIDDDECNTSNEKHVLFDDKYSKLIWNERDYKHTSRNKHILKKGECINTSKDKEIEVRYKYGKASNEKQKEPQQTEQISWQQEGVEVQDADLLPEPQQIEQFSWQQEGVEVQDADLLPDSVPQLPIGDPHNFDGEVRKEEIQTIKKEELSSPAKLGLTTDDEESDLHQGYKCNICSKDIRGFRYVCVQCADFDLCAQCEARRAHDRHYVLRIPGPRPHSEIQATLNAIRRTFIDAIVHIVNSEPIEVKDEEEFEDPIGLQPAVAGRSTSLADNDLTESDDDSNQTQDDTLEESDTPPKTTQNLGKSHLTAKSAKENIHANTVEILDESDHTTPLKKLRYDITLRGVKCDKITARSGQKLTKGDQNQQPATMVSRVFKLIKLAKKPDIIESSGKEGSAVKPILVQKVFRAGAGQAAAGGGPLPPHLLSAAPQRPAGARQLAITRQPAPRVIHFNKVTKYFSPKLFTNALEDVFKLVSWNGFGINVNGEYITHLRFSDDIEIMAGSLEELGMMLRDLSSQQCFRTARVTLERLTEAQIQAATRAQPTLRTHRACARAGAARGSDSDHTDPYGDIDMIELT